MYLQKFIKYVVTSLLFTVIGASLVHADGLVFPMTIWWTLKSWTGNVLTGATVSFLSSSWLTLWTLTTDKEWQYGGNTAFDNNVALQEFTWALTIKVTANSKIFTLTGWNLTRIDSLCPVASDITFVSKSCEYDINLNDSTLYAVVTSGGSSWGSSGWSGWWGWGGWYTAPTTSSSNSNSTTTANVKSGTDILNTILKKSTLFIKNVYISTEWVKSGKNSVFSISDSKSVVKMLSTDKKLTLTLLPSTNIIATPNWNKYIFQPKEIVSAGLKKLNLIAIMIGSNTRENTIQLSKPGVIEYAVNTNEVRNWTRFAIYVNNNGVFKNSGTTMVKNGKVTIYLDKLTIIVLKKIQ